MTCMSVGLQKKGHYLSRDQTLTLFYNILILVLTH